MKEFVTQKQMFRDLISVQSMKYQTWYTHLVYVSATLLPIPKPCWLLYASPAQQIYTSLACQLQGQPPNTFALFTNVET